MLEQSRYLSRAGFKTGRTAFLAFRSFMFVGRKTDGLETRPAITKGFEIGSPQASIVQNIVGTVFAERFHDSLFPDSASDTLRTEWQGRPSDQWGDIPLSSSSHLSDALTSRTRTIGPDRGRLSLTKSLTTSHAS